MQSNFPIPQQTTSSAIIIFQPQPNLPSKELESALSLQENASIQISFQLASECYKRTELVIERLKLQTAMIEKETQDLILDREERIQICNQLLEKEEQNKINHELTITTGFESITQINQQSTDIVQTHIEITNNSLVDNDENAKNIKIQNDLQVKEIENLRSSLASVHASINSL